VQCTGPSSRALTRAACLPLLPPLADAGQRGCGWSFEPAEVEPLVAAVKAAVRVYEEQPEVWRQVQQQGMRCDFGWAKAAMQYEAVLRGLVAAQQEAEAAKAAK
jgi:glycogen synthase